MLIDGHAHLHGCVPIGVALDIAAANLRGAAGSSVGCGFAGALWLVETRREGSIERLDGLSDGRWRWTDRDRVTRELTRDDGERLLVVFGRQVATSDQLEVLVVGTVDAPPDGRGLVPTVEAALGDERLVMLPWGFGKWSGSRGRAVSACLARYGGEGLHLADTAVRPSWLPTPGRIRRGMAAGRAIPFGSDPFPYADHMETVGSAGFVLADVPPEVTWPDMRRAVATATAPLERFGRRTGGLEFARLQARMQWRKHGPGRQP